MIGPRISHVTAQSRKRARHANAAADGFEEEAMEQTQLSEDQEQRRPQVLCKAVHHSSLQHEQQKPAAFDSFSPS